MASVPSRDTKPELIVRALAREAGFRYRLGGLGLPGRPDLVFLQRRAAIFVHGCFWHSHECEHGRRRPSSNQGYWIPKLEANRLRDRRVQERLRQDGWSVMVIWECELITPARVREKLRSFLNRKPAATRSAGRTGPRSK